MHYNYILFKQRCESFNSIIRAKNIFSNKHSPSKYIATNFGVEESIRNICSGISDKYVLNTHTVYKVYFMLLCKQGLVLNLWNCINLMLCRDIWENMWNQRSVFTNREPCARCVCDCTVCYQMDFQTCFTSCSYQQQPWNLVPLKWPSQNVVPSFSVKLLPAVDC